jgi:hypothetical protein
MRGFFASSLRLYALSFFQKGIVFIYRFVNIVYIIASTNR